MQLAITGAGYTPGEADQLRRDMAAWRKNGRLKRHRDKLLRGFLDNGVSAEFAEQIFRQILGFGEYGFPESHAASFALLVYASAYLKVHHAAAFAAALINAQPMGFYSPSSIVRDAQAHGVEVRPVRIEQSDWDCTLEPPTPSKEPQAIRLGMRLIRGLNKTSAERIAAERTCANDQRGKPFASIDDLVHRTGIRRDEVEKLAEAGALEGLIPGRREALFSARAPRETEGLYAGRSLETSKRVGLPALTAQEQLTLDYGTTGICIDDHPMRHIRKTLGRRRVRHARDAKTWRQDARVTVAGVVLTRQRPQTASGVVFITLEDETGTINLVLYSYIFERYELVARHAGILLARGKVDRKGPVVHVRATHLERLDMPNSTASRSESSHRAGLTIRSRDFH